MRQAWDSPLTAHRPAVVRQRTPDTTTLRWFAGVYFLLLGASLLLMPPGSLGLWLGSLWLRGVCTFASGMLLLWLIVLPPARPLALALHALAAAPHLVIAFEYIRLGGVSPAVILLLLGVGVLVAPLLPVAYGAGPRHPDALGLVLGTALFVQGLDLLLRTGAVIMLPPTLGIASGLVGGLCATGGLLVVLAQLAPALPRSAFAAAHVFAGGVVLALWALQSSLQDPLYWVLGVASLARGAALVALPWWSARVRDFDPHALRVRLAMALITAVLLPLMVVLPVVLEAVEQRRMERTLGQQQRGAATAALLVGELVRQQQALLGRLATGAGLPTLPVLEQRRALRAALAAESHLAELALYTPEGGLRAAGDGRAPASIAGGPLLPAPDRALASVAEPWSPVPTLAQALAIRDGQGQVVGILVAVAEPDAVASALTRLPLEPGGVVALVDLAGTPVVVSEPPGPALLPDLDTLWRSGATLAGAATPLAVAPSPYGARLLAAAPLPELPWHVVSVLPQAAAVADLVPVRQVAFAVTVLTALCAGLGGWWLTGLLARPIKELMLAVGRIADGQRPVPLPHSGPPELVSLSGAVGTMATTLDARLLEREELVTRLQAQNQELREYEELREESIRALSHDLRNPLTALSGNAQRLVRLLPKAGLDKETRIAQTMVALSQRMNVMIQDLADALRADGDAMRLRREPVDLLAAVQVLGAQLEDPEQSGRIRLLVAGAIPTVAADPAQLDRMLANLLSNALKYSPPDAPVLVSIQPTSDEVVVAVTDRGIGMSQEEQERLFRRYYRAESARAMTGGLGLGLYVTRALVEAHGGRIWVESSPGVGSTFRFTLPQAAEAMLRDRQAGETHQADGVTSTRHGAEA